MTFSPDEATEIENAFIRFVPSARIGPPFKRDCFLREKRNQNLNPAELEAGVSL